MATPYDAIHNSFLNKISDDFLLSLSTEALNNLLNQYRISASVKFKQCNKLSDIDDNLQVYNKDLTLEEIEILGHLMVLEWLTPQINTMELIKQSLSTKDYKIFSQANHLETLKKLKQETQAEINKLIVSYTYTNNSLDDLKRGV